MIKRSLDISLSALGLVVLSPLFLLVAVLIKLDSPGPVLFRQERIGQGFRPFTIFKFRTMQDEPGRDRVWLACPSDARITRVGGVLRRYKIDELPQLANVLLGRMSLVGPRPEVRQFVDMFRVDYEAILTVRPGITDLASIKFRNESTLLSDAPDPETTYVEKVLPEKIRLAKEYIASSSMRLDMWVMLQTALSVVRSR